ncbi:uncharacterized protein LOC121757670 [Salvia splendens]|uniref:uncharacterized protein LOC121757670 n=1 Tax=Salvia splendens TaxID=180675 RepID=UPI001C28081C|nr:uncharacterized protein LOC121757670 [Salvia splendens]
MTNAFLHSELKEEEVYIQAPTEDDKDEIEKLRANLFKKFEMNDLGNLKYFLGKEVMRTEKKIFLRQKNYILDLLDNWNVNLRKHIYDGEPVREVESNLETYGFTDAGYFTFVGGNLVIWLLTKIDFPPTKKSSLYCDNKAAISILENHVQHDRKIEGGSIEWPFVCSEDQLVDILTKAVNARLFNEVLCKLSMRDVITQLEGVCQNKANESIKR